MTSRTSSKGRARQRPHLHSTRARAVKPVAAFTLVEMLVVLALFGVLMGISIGMFRRSIPTRDVARNALLGALRQARLFATSENSPAVVQLEPGSEADWPTVAALGRRTVGGWHLESPELDGWPESAHGGGLEEEPRGAIGKAIRLLGTEPSWIDFGASPAYDASEGFALECFLKIDEPRSQTLFGKGRGFQLRSETDGGLTAQIQVLRKDEKGELKPANQSASSTGPALVPGRFTKVAVTFDGLQLRVSADDVVVAELVLQARAPFLPDRGAALICGATDAPADFVLDEVKWGIFAGDVQELRDMELAPLDVAPRQVRFGPDGALDPRFHAKPADLCVLPAGGDPSLPRPEIWIRVGMLGDVH